MDRTSSKYLLQLRVKNGSLEAGNELLRRIKSDANLLLEISPLLIATWLNLKKRPQTFNPLVPNKDVQLAVKAIEIFTAGITRASKGLPYFPSPPKDHLISTVVSYLSGLGSDSPLWKWCEYLALESLHWAKSNQEIYGVEPVIPFICPSLHLILSVQLHWEEALSVPSALSSVVAAWVHEDMFSNAFLFCQPANILATSGMSDPRPILDTIQGDVDRLAVLCLTHFRTAMVSDGDLELIEKFSSNNPALHARLIGNGSIPIVLSKMMFEGHLLNIGPSTSNRDSLLHSTVNAVRQTGLYLARVCSESFSFTLDALTNDLLPFMIISPQRVIERNPHLPETVLVLEQMILCLSHILGIIRTYTPYRSILRVVVRSIRGIEKRKLDLQLAPSDFKDSWIRFKEFVKERADIKSKYDKDHPKDRCGNLWKCPLAKGEPCHRYVRCGGCLRETYCSEKCRARAWCTGHARDCRRRRKCREEGHPEPISAQDDAFMHYMLSHDARNRARELFRLKAKHIKENPSVNPSTVGVFIDYTDPEIPAQTMLFQIKQPEAENAKNLFIFGAFTQGALSRIEICMFLFT